MIRVLTILLASVVFAPTTNAFALEAHYATSPSPSARYEILQSSITMRDTYRLDRFTGRVDRLISTGDGPKWKMLPVRGGLPSTQSTEPRFQLFLSGTATKGTYLIDTLTGKTWRLVEVPPAAPTEPPFTIWIPM